MKKIICFLTFTLLLSSYATSQSLVTKTLMHDDLEREYQVYLPASYDSSMEVPLVLNFHGLGSNATEQQLYSALNQVADTAGFILVAPQGTEYLGRTHWNVGGFTVGSTVDDVGFVDAMLDSLLLDYAIDSDRVYSTGMSNGGYMSYLLACQLSDRITAIASVTGSMTPPMLTDCDPQHSTPVMQIHGTADPTVPYSGAVFSESIPDVMSYWSSYNGCDSVEMMEIPDINEADGSTVDRFSYTPCDADVENVLYRVNEGRHTWPGSPLNFPGTNYDIVASVEIWNFFRQYDLETLQMTSSTQDIPAPRTLPAVMSRDYVNISGSAVHLPTVIAISGARLDAPAHYSSDGVWTVDISRLPAGTYIVISGSARMRVLKY